MTKFKELFTELKEEKAKFNPKDFKKGDKVITKFETTSGHLKADKSGIVTDVDDKGIMVKYKGDYGDTYQSIYDDEVIKESTHSYKGGSDSYEDARKIDDLIKQFDFYSHMIDDYSKLQKVEANNKRIKNELKKLGVTEISVGKEKRKI